MSGRQVKAARREAGRRAFYFGGHPLEGLVVPELSAAPEHVRERAVLDCLSVAFGRANVERKVGQEFLAQLESGRWDTGGGD